MGIHLMPPLFKQVIEPGIKYGDPTTVLYYPTPGSAGVATDGAMQNYRANVSWDTILAGPATDLYYTAAATYLAEQNGSVAGTYLHLKRSFYSFDTRLIPAKAKINSAFIRIFTYTKLDQIGCAPSYTFTTFDPTNVSAPPATDWSRFGSTPLSTIIPWADIAISDFNVFTLNDAGLAAINRAGVTSMGLREYKYDILGATLPWTGSLFQSRIIPYHADAPAYNRPYLSVTFQPPI